MKTESKMWEVTGTVGPKIERRERPRDGEQEVVVVVERRKAQPAVPKVVGWFRADSAAAAVELASQLHRVWIGEFSTLQAVAL